MGIVGTPLPGTYRVADGSQVGFVDALDAWVPLAYDELIATAHRYGAVTTYSDLAEHVQERSGIRTGSLLTHWIGRVLETVAIRAKANDEPPLTSLCVRQNGTIGPGYAKAPKSVTDTVGEDIELYAAKHRLLCYQKYADDLPAGGGEPTLTKAVADRRSRNVAREPVAPVICPRCFIAVPATGLCDSCGWESLSVNLE